MSRRSNKWEMSFILFEAIVKHDVLSFTLGILWCLNWLEKMSKTSVLRKSTLIKRNSFLHCMETSVSRETQVSKYWYCNIGSDEDIRVAISPYSLEIVGKVGNFKDSINDILFMFMAFTIWDINKETSIFWIANIELVISKSICSATRIIHVHPQSLLIDDDVDNNETYVFWKLKFSKWKQPYQLVSIKFWTLLHPLLWCTQWN